jgi:hypothetical protein
MLLPSPRSGKKSSRIYDRSKGRATFLQNLRSGGNVASKSAQRKSNRIYDRSKGGATLLQNLRSGGNVASKPEKEQQDLRPEQGRGNVAAESAQRKSSWIYDRSKGRATLLQNMRNGGKFASKPEKEQRDLRPEQGWGNVAAEYAQRG